MHEQRFPNETDRYRDARDELLRAEIELRRQTEMVAALRRALPTGGEIPTDYVFTELADGGERQVTLSSCFGEHKTLIVYNFMFGPKAKEPCQMCTSFLDGLDGAAEGWQQPLRRQLAGRDELRDLHQPHRRVLEACSCRPRGGCRRRT